MPGAITHLKTAYYYNKEKSFGFDAKIYLGSISPDSVNINGHAPKAVRWPAHLRNSDLDAWTENAALFYKENKGKTDEAFLRGYILHILTDIMWDRSFDKPMYRLLLGAEVPEDELKEERWNEIYGYEFLQREEDWLKNDVLPKLATATVESVSTLECEKVGIWRDQVVALDLKCGKMPRFMDESMALELCKAVFELAERVFV